MAPPVSSALGRPLRRGRRWRPGRLAGSHGSSPAAFGGSVRLRRPLRRGRRWRPGRLAGSHGSSPAAVGGSVRLRRPLRRGRRWRPGRLAGSHGSSPAAVGGSVRLRRTLRRGRRWRPGRLAGGGGASATRVAVSWRRMRLPVGTACTLLVPDGPRCEKQRLLPPPRPGLSGRQLSPDSSLVPDCLGGSFFRFLQRPEAAPPASSSSLASAALFSLHASAAVDCGWPPRLVITPRAVFPVASRVVGVDVATSHRARCRCRQPRPLMPSSL